MYLLFYFIFMYPLFYDIPLYIFAAIYWHAVHDICFHVSAAQS